MSNIHDNKVVWGQKALRNKTVDKNKNNEDNNITLTSSKR